MRSTKRTNILAILLLLLVGVSACPPAPVPPGEPGAKEESQTETPKTEATTDAGTPDSTKDAPKPAVDLFAPATLLKIEIEIPVADWDAIRKQDRNYDNFLKPDCMTKPWGSTFTYKSAVVTVQGKRLTNVGVRKKGFVGSIDSNKPSLKIKFDEYDTKQELFGRTRMTLNNNRQDGSLMRSCLAYHMFQKAGIPTPRCNFAQVFINGKLLGIYSHVEEVKKPFLERHFPSKAGRLYEGTLSDFREGWSDTYEAKTLKSEPDRKIINDMQAALKLPDDKLLAALAPLIDVDEFIRFWAAEVLVHHWDGYAGNNNNHFFYVLPSTNKMHFIPWGPDATFNDNSRAPKGAPSWVFANGALAQRLYALPSTQAKYVAQMKKFLDTIWKEADMLAEVDRMETLLGPHVKGDILHGKGDFAGHVRQIRDFIRGRRAQLNPVLTTPPAWNVPPRGPVCFAPAAKLTGTFKTTFGSIEVQDPTSVGSGEIKGEINGTAVGTGKVAAGAGYEKSAPGHAIVRVLQVLPFNRFLIIGLVFPLSDVTQDGKVALRGPLKGGRGYLVEFDGATRQSKVLGIMWSGSVTMTKSGTTKDAPVEGSFDINVVTSPF